VLGQKLELEARQSLIVEAIRFSCVFSFGNLYYTVIEFAHVSNSVAPLQEDVLIFGLRQADPL